MRGISKKISLVLSVILICLPILAPISMAEDLPVYLIKLGNRESMVWDINSGSKEDGALAILYPVKYSSNQKFCFYPLDNGKFAIVSNKSGKVMGIKSGRIHNGDGSRVDVVEGIVQNTWTGADDQLWYTRDAGSDRIEIINQGYSKAASYAYKSGFGGYIEYVDLDQPKSTDLNRVFKLEKTGKRSIPYLPMKSSRPSAPNYHLSPYENLPEESEHVVVGSALVPFFMVKDGSASDYTKNLNSPYYVMKKEEYWEKVFSTVVVPGSTPTFEYKVGMSTEDKNEMKNTVSFTVGADAGLKFDKGSVALKGEFTKTLETVISTSSSEMEQITVSDTLNRNGSVTTDTGFTKYILVTKYTLYRRDGSAVSNPWIVKNNRVSIIRTKS